LSFPDDQEHSTVRPSVAEAEGNGRSPDTLLDELTSAIEAYQVPGANSSELQALVKRLAQRHRRDAEVYVAKLTSESLNNAFWQGRTITGSHELYFFVLRTGSLDNAIREAKARLHLQEEGGFEAILIFEMEEDKWVPRHLYHYDDSDVPERLRTA